jgi:hypothetical protein
MEQTTQPVLLGKFLPQGAVLLFEWNKEVGIGKHISKNKTIGKVKIDGAEGVILVKSNYSGTVLSYCKDPVTVEKDTHAGQFEVMRVDLCKHPVVYDGVCTLCFESNIIRHTQKIFDQITSLSASDEIVKEKIEEITGGEKFILILDLDNTIIHAKNAPLDFNFEKAFPNEPQEIFEVCKSSKYKYIVKKRPYLDKFLQ